MKILVVDVGGTEVKWREYVSDVVARLIKALEPDDVVLGGGNVNNLGSLPRGCRAGDNANAFVGGFRIWEHAGAGKPCAPEKEVNDPSAAIGDA